MALDLEEQEQIASLKAWWDKYGNLTSWVLIVVLASYSGWTGWNYYQRNQSAAASALYDAAQVSLAAKDNTAVQRYASTLQTEYAGTAYAPMGALVAAKSAFEANDLKVAKSSLQWAAEHGNDEFKTIAKLRLAGVLLDEKAYDEALKTIASGTAPQFAGAVADRKGDILVAQNKLVEARAAYLAALAATDKRNPGHQLIQFKLESIGGTAPEVKPAVG